MPWAGASNIENGVTIDLSLLKAVIVNAAAGTATVLPGARWGDVYAELDKHNLAVVGGRASSVGSGGLVIGGGNSFYTARKGLVCDNVAEFEVYPYRAWIGELLTVIDRARVRRSHHGKR